MEENQIEEFVFFQIRLTRYVTLATDSVLSKYTKAQDKTLPLLIMNLFFVYLKIKSCFYICVRIKKNVEFKTVKNCMCQSIAKFNFKVDIHEQMRHLFFLNIFNKRDLQRIDHVVNVALEHMQRKYRPEFHSCH